MKILVNSIHAEYRRYKSLAEGAIAQLRDEDLCTPAPGNSNSIAVLVWHLSGNFASRFTDFLTSDGEKPWRDRESEFNARSVSRDELLQKWEAGWKILFATLDSLSDADLQRTVTIRNQPLLVCEALQRSLAHCAYHVGQITLIARMICGKDWKFLSIPPGGSSAYNQNPTLEKPK